MSSIWNEPGSTGGPATGAGGGGSIWGGGSSSTAAPAKSGGGGGIGGWLGGAGHWLASKASLAGRDIKGFPGGAITQAEAAFNDVILPHVPGMPDYGIGSTSNPFSVHAGSGTDTPHLLPMFKGMGHAAVQAAEHPLRDPFATVMWLAPGLHGAGRAGLGAAEGAAALRAGEGIKGAAAAAKNPALLRTPRTLAQPGGELVSLAASKDVLRRAYQAAHDSYVQRMIDTRPESIVAKYGAERMHSSLTEVNRARVRIRQGVVSNLRSAAQPLNGEIAKAAKGLGLELQNAPKTVAHAAIELVSHNTTVGEAILRAEYAIEHGINPERNAANVQLYREVEQLDLVHNHGTEVGINPEFKRLSKAERILHEGATNLDTQIADRNLRPAAQLENRRNLPAAVTQRLKPFVEPKITPAMRSARADFERVDSAYQRALDQEARWRSGEGPKNARGPGVSPGGFKAEGTPEQSNPYRNRVVRLGLRHEDALTRLQRLEAKQGVVKTSVPEDLLARQELLKFARGKFGEDIANERIGLLDQRAAQFARENDVPAVEFYRRYLKQIKESPTLTTAAGDLHEIAPFHGFAEEKVNKNMRGKTNPRTQGSGFATNRVTRTQEGIFFAGKDITPEDWLARVEHVFKGDPEAIDHAARWYEHFEPLFRKAFPPDIVDKIIRGFSVSQANASPSAGLASSLAAMERLSKGEEVGSIGSVVAANIEKALKGEHIDKFVAAKLSDFIDALRGSDTRTWMGHAAEGGAPAPIDIWGLRDLGYWDKKILSKGRGARLANMHGVNVDKLVADNGGSATGARYERASEKYHAITDHLNEIAYQGRTDWNPAQTQALGWAAIQKFYGQVPEDLATAITKGKVRAQGILSRGELQKVVTSAKEPDGGFTLHSDLTPDLGKEGFAAAYAHFEKRIPAAEFNTKDLTAYARAHRDILGNPNLRVGGWHNPADGQVYLDISRVFPTREEAMTFAREHGQLSVFDRAAAGAGNWDVAFPESGLSEAEADAIKNVAREKASAPQRYNDLVERFARQESANTKLTSLDRKYAEDAMHAWADKHPGEPLAQQFNKLYADAHEMKSMRMPQPEDLFSSGNGHIRGSYNPESATMRFASDHAIPETVTHEALHAIRQSLPELLQRKFENRYGIQDGQWSRAHEEKFVEDMLGVHNGTVTDPETVRMYHQLTAFVPGRSFTPLTTLEGGTPHAPISASQGPVIGEARDPLNHNFTSGSGLLEGRHQADVVDAVARHWHNVFRFFNTQEWRNTIAKTGSATRRSTRDILVRVDNRTEGGQMHPAAVGKITPEIDQLLGRKRDSSYTPHMEGEDAGVMASLEQFTEHLFPGRVPNSAEAQLEATAPEGTAAPNGYKWVDQHVAGNLDAPRSGQGHVVGRFMDNVNSAVTAATVYFKIGHITTRVFTNAATNIMQGSANPLAVRSAVGVWHDLTEGERIDALASAGTHYYEALPGATGEGRISRMIQHGIGSAHVGSPQWWAGVIDAPFRFNSLAYEVRKSAYGEGSAAFRQFQADLKGYDNLEPHARAEVDGVVRRANREAIAYDRLNSSEKMYLSRAVWFYPWVKGSTVWTAGALFEHPFKSAYVAQTGAEGRKEQGAALGDLPSYSAGVFQIAKGSPFPLTADFNTFNPEGTAGDLLQVPSHLSDLGGMLNPALATAQQVATSTDQYGTHTNHPLSSALQGMVASTPESQIVQAYLGRHTDQSHREYPGGPQNDPFAKTWLGEVLRMLLGPGAPRRFNPDAAHSLAERERSGR